jgi:adenine-specific DNA glycosylase
MSLWQSETCADWHAALDKYPEVIRAQGVNGLPETDAWYRDVLPGLIAARTPAFVTLAELERATVWKMKLGVWRERNRLLVRSNPSAAVKKISREAFAAVPDPRKPVDLLSTLAGVGPATSSAVLACAAPAIYPFFDELVAVQIPRLGKVAFTAVYYQRYAAALRERTARLNERCTHRDWTAHEISQALWAASGGKAAQE